MTRWPFGVKVLSVICSGALLGLPVLVAQEAAPPAVPAPAQAQQQLLSADQLDDLVAPIALYPDPLLGQVLVASTYPLEIVEAQQWLQSNPGLRDRQLMDAARQQNWDASVQALVAFPDALHMLDSNVQWTTQLGNAFLAQQADVMGAVQRMRARAQANGKLQATPQEQVTTVTQNGQPAIEILPADPQVIYVPYYDPYYVWGPPLWGYYPAFGYTGFGFWPGINIGLCFGGWGGWGWGGVGFGWGWGPNWFGHSIFVNNGFFNRYGFRGGFNRGLAGNIGGRTMWQHDPSHRLGVAYPNRQLSGRFQAASAASRGSMSRPAAGTSWNRFGAQGSGAQGFHNGAAQNMNRGFQSGAAGQAGRSQTGVGNAQRFQGQTGNTGSGQRFQGSQRYEAPRNQGMTQQRFQSAPQQRFQSAPQAAPRSFGGGGGGGAARSFGGGGGGGGARSFGGGGGGARSSGGGGGGGHHGR